MKGGCIVEDLKIFNEEVVINPEKYSKVQNRKKFFKNKTAKEKDLEKRVLRGDSYKVLRFFSEKEYDEYYKKYDPKYICSKEVECIGGDFYLDVFEDGDYKSKKMTGRPLDRDGLKLLKEYIPIKNLKNIKVSEDDFVAFHKKMEKRIYFLDKDKNDLFYIRLEENQNNFSPLNEVYEWDEYFQEKFAKYFGEDFGEYTKRYYREYMGFNVTNEKKYSKFKNLSKRSKWYKRKNIVSKYRIKEKEILDRMRKVSLDSIAFERLLESLPNEDSVELFY